MRFRSLSGSVLGASGASNTNWGERHVFTDQIRTTLPSCRRPLGGCRINVNRQGAGFEPIFPKWRLGRRKIRRICQLDKCFSSRTEPAVAHAGCWYKADQTPTPRCSVPALVFFSAVDRPVLPLSFSFGVDRNHAQDGGARRRRMAANHRRG